MLRLYCVLLRVLETAGLSKTLHLEKYVRKSHRGNGRNFFKVPFSSLKFSKFCPDKFYYKLYHFLLDNICVYFQYRDLRCLLNKIQA